MIGDLDDFKRNIEQLDSREIEQRLAEGVYEDSRQSAIAKQVIESRRRQLDDSRTQRRDAFARRAVIAAWIAAICAILSVLSAIINIFFSHSNHP
jgi:hypothetical protein